ncbi:MAG: tRNA (N(6)-L-threonylcarbamoyladenosine(37)-C(2))-methylthiotransferase MtaB [Bacilli bacterium]|nr:tRNA (N(6)-L-threonylcarbamoyladenosine(37)-C(2))-methylthiotransferase MtaB [Bacilli bacterium]
MKFHIITLGCKVNFYESEVISESLVKNGYTKTDNYLDADIIIINTCSVTNVADNKSKKSTRRIKRENPNAILVVCGCSSQNKQDEYKNMGIDILLGNKDKSKIVEILKDYKKDDRYTKFYNDRDLEFEDMIISDTTHTRAYVKIQDGCNNFCSYCIIPYVRGNIRSKNFEKTIDEIKKLVASNHSEIVLTGIHTGSYNDNGKSLVDLINEISKIDNLKRIRISSIEVTELDDTFMDLLKNNTKVCNHLHIPLQAGSDEILKKMNRKYDLQRYEEIINKIRSIRPDINITTDVIVGHPYETDELFNETLKFCKKMQFGKIHVFPYSVREGTAASVMPNQVPNDIKKIRAKKLILLSNQLELDYTKRYLNKKIDVLIEEKHDNYYVGHTSNYLKVYVSGDAELHKFYKVKINKIAKDMIEGIIIKR